MTTRCAVWGSPIGHSLSPVLHRAAYDALGLHDWSYERREVDEPGFAAALAGLDETWRGLSLTMPLKEAALAAADSASPQARHTGSANTLVRSAGGWVADNTDVHGIVEALRESGRERVDSAIVVGSGATARSAVAAVAALGARQVSLMVRAEPRPETVRQAAAAGLAVAILPMGAWSVVDVVVSTVPPSAIDRLDDLPECAATVLDVVYGDGETVLQRAARERGWRVVDGTAMLLHQAAEQVRLMTGQPAPIARMQRALGEALAALR